MTLKKSLALIAVSACIGLSFSVIAAFAWDGPTQTAPNGNVAAPVNVGGVFQNKTGAAWFDGGIGIDDGSAFCIGGDCIDTWPTSPWELAGTSLYYTGGNVGIGTDTPIATLDINGYARLAPQSAEPVACDAAHIGSIAFSEAAQSLCVCTIEGWDSSTGQACWTTADAPPTVALTAPSNGATVSGTITVTASASDDVGVVDVQFYLDGVKFVVEDAIPPYSRFWDTSTASNGSHTLTAVARDTIDQTTTSNSVTVTVSNSVVTPGSQTFSTPGTYSFTVPAYNTLTVQVWEVVGVDLDSMALIRRVAEVDLDQLLLQEGVAVEIMMVAMVMEEPRVVALQTRAVEMGRIQEVEILQMVAREDQRVPQGMRLAAAAGRGQMRV